MNPMRSLAPDAVGGQLSTYWIYLAGPMIGATIAVGFEYILKGRQLRPARRRPRARSVQTTPPTH
jgi:Major intrinsic protein